MHWKYVVCAVLISGPAISRAGNNHAQKHSKALANNVNARVNANPLSEFARPARSEKIKPPKSSGKTEREKKNTAVAKPEVTPNYTPAPGMNINPGSESYFTHVPLAGEQGYYGANSAYVVGFLKNYMERNKVTLSRVKARSTAYFPMIDNTFQRAGLPAELKYVSVIESALNNTATSKVGAAGPWQFMPATGRMMGLVVNGNVDERRDWKKSTTAAAKYLGYLYDLTDDWLLAIASYNCGPRPVLNAIKKTGKANFFDIKSYLPQETQNYVMAFIATATSFEKLGRYIENGVPENFNWASLNTNIGHETAAKQAKMRWSKLELSEMAIVRIDKPIDLDVIAGTLNVDRMTLGRWNYDILDYMIDYQDGKRGEVYNLRIPKDKIEQFYQTKSKMEKTTAENL